MKKLEQTVFISFLLCFLTPGTNAQGTDSLGRPSGLSISQNPDTTFLVTQRGDTLLLSDFPSGEELAQVFIFSARGDLDPFIVLPAVIGKGPNALPALKAVLFSPPLDTVGSIKIFAVMALEGIGTQAAYQMLFVTAQTHANPDVRGSALNVLATTFHNPDQIEKIVPDKELVHLLLNNVDDTAAVPCLQKSFGQIARRGLIEWLGKDFGEPQGRETRPQNTTGTDAQTLAGSREAWWRMNASRITWDSESRIFTEAE